MSNKTRCYEIAGIPVALTGEAEHFFEDDGILAGFRDDAAEPAWVYSLAVCDELAIPAGALCATEPGFCVVRSGEEVLTCFGAALPDDPGVYATTQRTPKESRIRYLRTKYIRQISPKQALRCMELPHLLAVNDGILLHCSWIRWKGRGILFTAPSGVGKSTQAQLWCDAMGAELINGDRAAIRIRDGRACAFGIPMSGSSDVRKNEVMPIWAIVYLTQAPVCRIERLRGVRAFRRVWEGCTVPMWDRADMERLTDTVGRIIGQIPVFHLACTPDKNAVDLLHETIEVTQC